MTRLLAAALTVFMGAPAMARETDWELIKTDDDIKIYRKHVEGSNVLAFRGEGVLPASVEKVLGILGDNERRKKWMPDIKSSKTLKEYNPYHRIEVNHLGTPWPLKDRFFVTEGRLKTLESGVVMIEMKSVPDQEFAQDAEGRILGEMHLSLYELHPMGPDKTKFIVEFHTDPKGALPTWMVNFFQKGFPYDLIVRLKEQASDPTVVAVPKPPKEGELPAH